MIRPRSTSGRQRGTSLLESAMYLPILFLIMFGMIELAKVTYTYYTLQKILLSVARYAGSQQGVNFCDDADTIVQQAKQFALTGSGEDGAASIVQNLAADQIQVRIERFTPENGEIGVCQCSVDGCDTANGGASPDYIVVSIPDGYSFRLAIPNLPLDPILLKPRVRMPYQGT